MLLSVVLLFTLTLMEMRNRRLSRSPLMMAVWRKFYPLLSGCSAAPGSSSKMTLAAVLFF